MGTMGLFESNYTRIAKKTSKYYFELKRSYADRFDNEVSILATAGVLDAQWYVFGNQTISISDLLQFAKISFKKPLDIKSRKNIALISFIVELEITIFSIDTRLNTFEIRDAVMSKLNKIEKSVLKTQKENNGDKKIESDVHKFMIRDEFKSYRQALGIKEIENI